LFRDSIEEQSFFHKQKYDPRTTHHFVPHGFVNLAALYGPMRKMIINLNSKTMRNQELLQLDFGLEFEKRKQETPVSLKKSKSNFVFDMMDCLTSPIIVHDSAWRIEKCAMPARKS
jgi:hypothetical protein